MHQIGEVAEVSGLSLRTLRHWDEMGVVIPSSRSPGGFRLYTDDDIERIHYIMRLRLLELSLDEMKLLADARAVVRSAERLSETEESQALARLAVVATHAEQRIRHFEELLADLRLLTVELRADAAMARQFTRSSDSDSSAEQNPQGQPTAGA